MLPEQNSTFLWYNISIGLVLVVGDGQNSTFSVVQHCNRYCISSWQSKNSTFSATMQHYSTCSVVEPCNRYCISNWQWKNNTFSVE
jgi:hypothetical protein